MAKRKKKFTTGLWNECKGRFNSFQIWHVEPGAHKIGNDCSWFVTVSAEDDKEAVELGQLEYAKYLKKQE